MKYLLRIPLTRRERDAALRANANPLKGLSKANAKKVGDFLIRTDWECDLKVVQELKGNAYLEVWPHGREVTVWLPAKALRKIDNVGGALGLPGAWVSQKLLEQAASSKSALKCARAALGGAKSKIKKTTSSVRTIPVIGQASA